MTTWLITGAGRGLGRAFTEGALARGDHVVTTARRPDALASALEQYGDRALVLPLDVNDRAAVHATIEQAVERMGQLDVVVNNAGYGLAGGVEEVTEEQARAQFDTNFFGALWVTQAVLPHLRARRSGHIIQLSSISAVKSGINLGIYCASKAALDSMSEALAKEVAPFGIKVTIVEPSMFRTDWAGSSMERATPMSDYDDVLAERREEYAGDAASNGAPGDPALAAKRLVEIVENPEPPLRLLLGNKAVDIANKTFRGRLDAVEEWEAVSRSADAPSAEPTDPMVRDLVDSAARVGRELLADVAGPRAEAVADLTAAAMFTPACLASGRLAVGLEWLRNAGFSVVHLSRVWLTESEVDRVWLHQLAGFTAERWGVAGRLFSAGPAVVAVMVSKDGASPAAEQLKRLQGPSDPERLATHTLRAHLGAVNKLNNLVHVPEDVAATVRELSIMLGESGTQAAWNAVLAGRRAPDPADAIAGLGSALDDGVCFVKSAARLRWRAVLLAEGLAGQDAPPDLRSALWTELEWATGQPWGGWQTIEAWRKRFGPRRAGEEFASWLGQGSALTKAVTRLDTLVSGSRVDLAALEASIQAAGLAPSTWELLAVQTQAVANDLTRRG